MLSTFLLKSPTDRFHLLESFDPMTETWLVSDLKSKIYLQNELLKKHEVLPEHSVLRASELWKRIFVSVLPEHKIVSEGLATLLIGDWLKARGDWAHTPGASRVAFSYLSYLMPIFAHDSGVEGMKSWFAKNPEAYERWGHWFVESYYLWNQFSKHRLAVAPWLSAHLMNLNLSKAWERPLWVDLGMRMHSVETDVLSQLSQNLEIKLIQPSPSWLGDFSTSMGAYDILNADAKPVPTTKNPSQVFASRFSSPLGEAKNAVSLIRQWVSKGVSPESIACVAPQISLYSSVLRLLLEREGFPVMDRPKANLSTFPDVHAWLSSLQVSLGNFESGHLETASYSSGRALMPYHEFIRLYKIIYDTDDLKRVEKVYDDYQNKFTPHRSRQTCREFLEWALLYWRGPDPARLIRLLDLFFSDSPSHLELDNQDWLSHLNMTAVKSEEVIGASLAGSGIQLADLHSSENLQSDRIIILGLTEEALRKSRKLGVLPRDIWSIQRELGFNLPLTEDVNSEFDAAWLLESSKREFHLSCPMADWDGASTAPSVLWFRYGDHKVATSREVAEIAWNFSGDGELQSAIDRDRLGRVDLRGRTPDRLSISSIEDFAKCPFIYSAKKIFKCDDNEFVDLEMGPQSAGKLRHRLLERILESPAFQDLTHEDLETLVEQVSIELEIVRSSDEIWKNQKRRLVNLGMRFIEYERALRQRFPQTHTIARELSFEVYFDPVSLNISEAPPGVWTRGSIDRIDEDEEGRVIIIDYKSSTGKLSNWQSWIEKRSLQLGFYADVVASGLTTLGQREVIGAFFVNLKDFEREKGFARRDADNVLFSLGKRKFGLRIEEQQSLFKNLRKLTAESIVEMEAGNLHPTPRDQATCETCRWKNLCRGAHLV